MVGSRLAGRRVLRARGFTRAVLGVAMVAALVAGVVVAGPALLAAAQSASPGAGLAWGGNTFGQLGNGSTANSSVPVQVSLPSGTTITDVAAGFGHSLALTSTGRVLAWGTNFAGQLGDGSTTSSNVPVEVSLPPETTVTAVAAGYHHSLALASNGEVFSWGNNELGQLGDGSTTNRSVPVRVSLPSATTITDVAGGYIHSLAVTSTGQVLAWGDNVVGALGDGTTSDSALPVRALLPPGSSVAEVAGGYGFSLARTSGGKVLAWGSGHRGSLGNGTTTDSSVPVAVSLPTGTTATAISAAYHGLAVTAAGHVFAWGHNSNGELGDGSTTDRTVPVPVSLPPATTITEVSAGEGHSLALTSTGRVLAWGGNYSGELGDGTTTSSSVPVAVSLPAGTTATTVEAGVTHSLAVSSPGRQISGTYTGVLRVTEPTTVAPGTRILGGIIISGRGSLHAADATFYGPIVARGGAGLRLCGSTVNNLTAISGMDGTILLGDLAAGLMSCPGNTFRGPVTLSGNTGYLGVGENRVTGFVSVRNNTTTAAPAGYPNATTIAGNTIDFVLTCTGNTPPPTNNGDPNVVRGFRTGQCASL